jgi:hypothetical protein
LIGPVVALVLTINLLRRHIVGMFIGHCVKGCGSYYDHSGPCKVASENVETYRTIAAGPTPAKQLIKLTCSKIESGPEGIYRITFRCDDAEFPKLAVTWLSERQFTLEFNARPTYEINRSYYLALPEPS